MGHHVSEEGVVPDPTKVEAILQFPQLTSKSAPQRFLGMANYLNAFCPNLSSVIHPLLQLTRKLKILIFSGPLHTHLHLKRHAG